MIGFIVCKIYCIKSNREQKVLSLLTNYLPQQRNVNTGTRVLTLKMFGVVRTVQVYFWNKSSNFLKLITILLLIVIGKLQFSTTPFLLRPYRRSLNSSAIMYISTLTPPRPVLSVFLLVLFVVVIWRRCLVENGQ